MADSDTLNHAFRDDTSRDTGALSKRQRRAARTRERALSPVRILLSLMLVPVVATGMTATIFIRTSDFGSTDALRHLIAIAGCDAAQKVQVAPAMTGQPGYHKANDPDGDGVACEMGPQMALATPNLPESPETPQIEQRLVGGAKFIKP